MAFSCLTKMDICKSELIVATEMNRFSYFGPQMLAQILKLKYKINFKIKLILTN